MTLVVIFLVIKCRNGRVWIFSEPSPSGGDVPRKYWDMNKDRYVENNRADTSGATLLPPSSIGVEALTATHHNQAYVLGSNLLLPSSTGAEAFTATLSEGNSAFPSTGLIGVGGGGRPAPCTFWRPGLILADTLVVTHLR